MALATAAKTSRICTCSGLPHEVTTTRPWGRSTRRSSRTARLMSSAKITELAASTASKCPSGNGSCSRSPWINRACGNRSRAMVRSSLLASRPVTSQPSSRARAHAPAPPHPASSKRVPGLAPSAERVSFHNGRQNGSCNSAQSRGAVLQSLPCRSPDAMRSRILPSRGRRVNQVTAFAFVDGGKKLLQHTRPFGRGADPHRTYDAKILSQALNSLPSNFNIPSAQNSRDHQQVVD
jgi:hypothetical protein